MRSFFGGKKGHQRLESGDQTNEVQANETAGMQAVVVNVMVAKGEKLGCEFNNGNYVLSVVKGSIAALKGFREGDLVVQARAQLNRG